VPDSIEIPWQVRWARWWWRREARWCLRRGNRACAASAIRYARGVVAHWRATGEIPTPGTPRDLALQYMAGVVPYPADP
jgi:hypothetical protein